MSEPLIVIGLTGVAESGKDEVARMLAHHRYRFLRIALADTVRAMLHDLDFPTGAFTKELTRAGLTPRWAHQRIGGDARERTGRAIGQVDDVMGELHVNRCYAYVALFKMLYCDDLHPVRRNRFVVPDVSHVHEINVFGDVLRTVGGRYETWRILKPGAGLAGPEAEHASELGRATIPVNRTIVNDGSLDNLEQIVRQAADTLLASRYA